MNHKKLENQLKTYYEERNKEICAVRKDHTLEELAQKFKITRERVRQICLRCEKGAVDN